jgi:hypothetical protein
MLRLYRIFVMTAIAGIIMIGGCKTADVSKTQVVQTANVIKGPYLIYPGNNTQMTVLWQTDSSLKCELSWGTDTTYSSGNATASEYGKDHQHKYTITGLVPGKKYYYRVATIQETHIGSFLAAPPDNATAVEFLGYGDTRTNPAEQNKVCGNIVSAYTANPNCQTFILHVGDWVSGNSEKDWAAEFFDRTYSGNTKMQANLPIQGCMGNHEGSGTVYVKYWPYPYVADRYWSFDYGPAHIAIIDQYVDYGICSAQLKWLENDLSGTARQWKFIVLHEPGWSAGGYHYANEQVKTLIQPLCKKYGVQIVFTGHHHYYARAEVDGVQHVTLGTGGAPFHKPAVSPPVVSAMPTLGYCKVSIRGNMLNFEMFKSPENTVIDNFKITRP